MFCDSWSSYESHCLVTPGYFRGFSVNAAMPQCFISQNMYFYKLSGYYASPLLKSVSVHSET